MLDRRTVRRGRPPALVALEEFGESTGCDLGALPRGVVVVARDPARGRWWASSDGPLTDVLSARLGTLLAYVDQLGGRLENERWWTAVCLEDAWHPAADRDGSEPQRLLAFGRRAGDTSTALIPDTHYLYSLGYLKTSVLLRLGDRTWSRKAASAIYCGGRHGLPVEGNELARERLQRLAQHMDVPVEVHLDGDVSLARQLAHRMVIDLDGYARTWDAWAWKTRSCSAVLSQESPWESFFSVQFEPWQHFVPLANDLLDTEEKVRWCLANDAELRQIAGRATERARLVYGWAAVKARTRRVIEELVFPAG